MKMINGDTNPRGPGLLEEAVEAACNGEYSGRRQVIHSGSYGYVEDKPHFHLESFTMVLIWPTTPKTHPKYWRHGAQGLMVGWCDNQGYGLFINEQGCLEMRINGEKITTNAPIVTTLGILLLQVMMRQLAKRLYITSLRYNML